MKAFIVLCVLVPILALRLPDKDKAFLKQVHETCQANKATFAEPNLIKKLTENTENRQVQIHMRCMAEKAGLMKQNGDLDMDVIKARVGIVTQNPADVPGLVQKCAVKKDNPEKTAVNLWACFVKNNIPYQHVL